MSNGGSVNLRVSLEAQQARQALKALGAEGRAALAQLDQSLRQPNAALRLLDAGIGNIRGSIASFAGQAGAAGSTLSAIGPWGVAAAAGIGVATAAFTALTAAVEKNAAAAADLVDQAERVGIGVEALQEIGQAGELAGVKIEATYAALETLNGSIGALKTGVGDGKLRAAFAEIGIGDKDLKNISTADQLLPLLADHISRLSTTAEQVQIARKLGVEALLPLLRQGSTGLEDLTSKSRRLGLVLDEETVAALDAVDESLRQATVRSQNAGMELSSSLTPAVIAWKNELADAKTWLAGVVRGLDDFISRHPKFVATTRAAIDMLTPGGAVRAVLRRAIGGSNGDAPHYTAADIQARLDWKPEPKPTKPPPVPPLDPDKPGKSGGKSGPTEAELKARRELLALQTTLELTRAKGDKAQIARLEDELEVRKRVKELIDAGMKADEAKARASEDVAAVRLAKNLADAAAKQETWNRLVADYNGVSRQTLDLEKALADVRSAPGFNQGLADAILAQSKAQDKARRAQEAMSEVAPHVDEAFSDLQRGLRRPTRWDRANNRDAFDVDAALEDQARVRADVLIREERRIVAEQERLVREGLKGREAAERDGAEQIAAMRLAVETANADQVKLIWDEYREDDFQAWQEQVQRRRAQEEDLADNVIGALRDIRRGADPGEIGARFAEDLLDSILDELIFSPLREEIINALRGLGEEGGQGLFATLGGMFKGGAGGNPFGGIGRIFTEGGWTKDGGVISNLARVGSSLFGGFRADGGRTVPGVPYIVGERRPEVFVPDHPGSIIPSFQAFDRSQMRATLGGAPAAAPKVEVHTHTQAPLKRKESKQPDGSTRIDLYEDGFKPAMDSAGRNGDLQKAAGFRKPPVRRG